MGGEKKKDFWTINALFLPTPVKTGDVDIYNVESINNTFENLSKRALVAQEGVGCLLPAANPVEPFNDLCSLSSGASRNTRRKSARAESTPRTRLGPEAEEGLKMNIVTVKKRDASEKRK